jgi:gamma-glutamylcyclotransferase
MAPGDTTVGRTSITMKYFAYGSNMLEPWLRSENRIPGATFFAVGYITGWKLHFHKKSKDGSGKCNILKSESDSDVVYGVVFDVPQSQIAALDKVEGAFHGYVRTIIEVLRDGALSIRASVYMAESGYIKSTLAPYTWYRDLVVAGAREHNLPAPYIARLAGVASVPDPDTKRSAPALEILRQYYHDFTDSAD